MTQEKSIFTQSVHAGRDIAQNHGALSTPIYNASTFAFENADEGAAVHNHEKPGYFYSRLGNPTQGALEKVMTELEHGEDALAFASGMAAISAVILTLVKSGEHIVALESMYSTTTSLLRHLSENFGVNVTFVDATDPANYEKAVRKETKLFWIETPSNPMLNVSDISAITNISKANGILSIADNTFATPFNQNPLDLGVDIVMHSATKYLGGHSDLTAGVLVGKDKDLINKIRLAATRYYGGNMAPQVAWLILRGIKTLALRMKQHNKNAYALAYMLQSHPKIKSVFYPGLEDHPNHNIAKKQMTGFGGMISFDVEGFEIGRLLTNNVELCSLATSLGGVETIIQHSASMTNGNLTPEERKLAGISEGLIRLSVGIEDADDIFADLENALSKI